MGAGKAPATEVAAMGRCFRLKDKLEEGDERDLARAVAQAKLGDMEGYRYIYARFADNVYSYVRKIVRGDHDAEDVTQQVFAKLFTAIGRYEVRDVPFAAWILRVARNVAIDNMRRDRLVPVENIRSQNGNSEYAEIGYDRRHTLTCALRRLPRDQRRVVMLRNLAGLTPGEIASQIGKSESAVHGLHHRGRQTLKRELERGGVAPALAVA
jgi:RNA polymerase sigma-70 factor (ECF subfamily)